MRTVSRPISRRNAAFYARYGFEVMGVVEAPGYPEIVAMWRPARSVQLAA
jgi:hypothetical protein